MALHSIAAIVTIGMARPDVLELIVGLRMPV